MKRDADRVRDIVRRCGWNVTSWQILNPGFTYWVHPGHDAVVGYIERNGVRVVGGAPVCADEHLEDVVAAFESDASAAGAGVIYFAAERRMAELARAEARRVTFPIGAQPFWDAGVLTREFDRHASLRAQLNRVRNKGVTTREISTLDPTTAAALHRCLAEWIEQRPLPPLHFLIETETLRDVVDRRLFAAELGGDVVGFLVATPVPARGAWLIEQIVRGAAAPNGTAELLLHHATGTLPGRITLGLAPLARRGDPLVDRAPRWVTILLARLRAHGGGYFNFEGLERFKAKFGGSSWDVVYASVAPGTPVTRALLAVTAAFSGESLLPFAARAMRRRLAGSSAGMWMRTRPVRSLHQASGKCQMEAGMSRAFVNEDRDDDVPRVHFTLPPFNDPSYPRAAALALIEAACDGHTSEAEEATGYRFGEPQLHRYVRSLLEQEEARPEMEQDRRLITVAKRFLR